MISGIVIAASRVLLKCSDGDEDNEEWQGLRDALEVMLPIIPCEISRTLAEGVNDFDRRLSVKMIGRP
jgi:hypothetical protein